MGYLWCGDVDGEKGRGGSVGTAITQSFTPHPYPSISLYLMFFFLATLVLILTVGGAFVAEEVL